MARINHLGDHGDMAGAHHMGRAKRQYRTNLGLTAAGIDAAGLIPPTTSIAVQIDPGNFAGVGGALQMGLRGGAKRDTEKGQSHRGNNPKLRAQTCRKYLAQLATPFTVNTVLRWVRC